MSEGAEKMNWRRGLFRLWVVGSVLFVIAYASLSYSFIKAEFDAVARAPKPVTDPKLVEQLEMAPWDTKETAPKKPFDPDEFLARFDKPNPWATVAWVTGVHFAFR
jgi:hypothetical protein